MMEPDFITEELSALHPDGRRATVIVRIGKPFKAAPANDPDNNTHVCPVQLDGIDDKPFPVHGEGPIQALHLGLSKVQVDLECCQETLGLRFVWPDGAMRDVKVGWWNGGPAAG
jgi:hypothetical protein